MTEPPSKLSCYTKIHSCTDTFMHRHIYAQIHSCTLFYIFAHIPRAYTHEHCCGYPDDRVSLETLLLDVAGGRGGGGAGEQRIQLFIEHGWLCHTTRWRRCIGCLIFIGHFLQKSPIDCGSFAERDLQLKASYAFLPLCIAGCFMYLWDMKYCGRPVLCIDQSCA